MVSVINKKVLLNNGVQMPIVGFGTFRIRTQDDIIYAVDKALAAGYRMFDTAAVYGNESFLKVAFRNLLPKYGLKRKDIFITTKLSPSDHGGGEKTKQAYLTSIDRLGVDYVDLYLIHWPGASGIPVDNKTNTEIRDQTWSMLVELYSEGLVKAIGVSNYTVRHLEQLLSNHHGVIPAVNQVEWHPYYHQEELKKYCEKNKIVLQAYCSFGGTSVNDMSLLKDSVVVKVADKYNVTSSQVLLKWAIQQGVCVIPKSMTEKHIRENIELNFVLEESELCEINSLKQIKYAWNPNTVV